MTSPDSNPAGQAQDQWSRIIDGATTAQQHAAIIEVRRQFGRDQPPPLRSMVDAYRRVFDSKRHAGLDSLPIDAATLTDLAVIVDAGAAGMYSRRLPYWSRQTLHRMQLVTHTGRDGIPLGPDEVGHSTVRATLTGIAVARAARSRVFPLSETDAFAFARLDADGGLKHWPGTAQAERIARYWHLVDEVDGWYRLTPAGRAALNEHRTPSEQIMASKQQGGVLTYAARTGRPVDLQQFDGPVIQQCVTRQWLIRAGLVPGARRAAYRITESGRDALDRWREAERKRLDSPERVTAVHLEKGMWVRLANRQGLPVTDAYVQVVDATRTQDGLVDGAGNTTPGYAVTVVDEPGGTPYLYGGKPFYPVTKYEVRPSRTAAA